MGGLLRRNLREEVVWAASQSVPIRIRTVCAAAIRRRVRMRIRAFGCPGARVDRFGSACAWVNRTGNGNGSRVSKDPASGIKGCTPAACWT
ncbi:hypothetical protein [Paenibacillus xylaniclasticus]|uniref:hypothetical protein n=1 Tax=Paenibacillus xylaniclasticus TaxID=588083 RepID=UPI000FDAF7C4|nr:MULTISPECIES: hypothetical protein [Paenibacillus]GFN33789.1 hypothetical protein PCURB6_40490 [Paenibacillus curdlanolyticus]